MRWKCVDLIDLSQYRETLGALVSMEIYLRVPKNSGEMHERLISFIKKDSAI